MLAIIAFKPDDHMAPTHFQAGGPAALLNLKRRLWSFNPNDMAPDLGILMTVVIMEKVFNMIQCFRDRTGQGGPTGSAGNRNSRRSGSELDVLDFGDAVVDGSLGFVDAVLYHNGRMHFSSLATFIRTHVCFVWFMYAVHQQIIIGCLYFSCEVDWMLADGRSRHNTSPAGDAGDVVMARWRPYAGDVVHGSVMKSKKAITFNMLIYEWVDYWEAEIGKDDEVFIGPLPLVVLNVVAFANDEHGDTCSLVSKFKLGTEVILGIVKDSKDHIGVQRFHIYHKNRLIKPVWNAARNDVLGVLAMAFHISNLEGSKFSASAKNSGLCVAIVGCSLDIATDEDYMMACFKLIED
ncbi:hypothetical protein E3N88_26344 [Mikania micrantha]|uniref:Morc S5 domain-containing protein n=1 Tax=Mikania micrantha TaxID=192012 RepID=A0A5N6N7B6_9ASTR|nr:hypothetical protein E3N88_26344 [Mikania micrantha]